MWCLLTYQGPWKPPAGLPQSLLMNTSYIYISKPAYLSPDFPPIPRPEVPTLLINLNSTILTKLSL